MIIATPADYVSWIEAVDKFSNNKAFSTSKRKLYIAGSMSERAHAQLLARSWEIHQNSTLFTSFGEDAQNSE